MERFTTVIFTLREEVSGSSETLLVFLFIDTMLYAQDYAVNRHHHKNLKYQTK
jgi:hypothetical protein